MKSARHAAVNAPSNLAGRAFAPPSNLLWMGLQGTLALMALFLIEREAQAAEYYVAPTGSDSNAGSLLQPFATLQKGSSTAVAGDTVYIRGGTYNITRPTSNSAGISFTRSGTSDTNRIKYWAHAGEVPVFDFSGMTISSSGYTHGFVVSGSWLHFKGIEIRGVPMNTRSNNAIAVNDAHDNIFELLNLHHNAGTGIFIGNGTGGHLILNCDAHDNYDPTSTQGDGQNADGFGLHYQSSGAVSTFRGCRAWWNSDDGFDFISQEFPAVIENCWAMGNGYINSGTARPGSGNGNGFKVGSSKTAKRHIVRNSLAWRNVAAGFYANHSSGGNDWFNNTSYNNGTQYNMLASLPTDSSVTIILSGALAHKMRNNIGFPNKNSNMGGVDTMFNSWDLNLVPAAADFLSTSDTGFMASRQADGSLPALDFMKPCVGSRIIDKGTNVNLPYVGASPDLGAFEFGATPGGGAGGAGGTRGTGGAVGSGGSGGNTAAGTGGISGGGSGGAFASGGRGSGGGGISNATGGASWSGGASGTGGATTSPGTGGRLVSGAQDSGAGPSLSGGGTVTGGCACALDGGAGRGAPASFLLVILGLLALAGARQPTRSPRAK